MKNEIFTGLIQFTFWIASLWLVCAFISYLFFKFTDIGRDDSDTETERSGMRVLTDNKTGLQYLVTSGGGITPRLDSNGNQVRKNK